VCETADHTMPYRASTCFGNGEQTMTYCMLYGFVSFGGVRGNRYADERLVCLDVLLIGVNCCIFNGHDTPYYPLGTKFIAGALKVLKPKPAKEGGTSSSRKMQGKTQVHRTPARGESGESSSMYYDEDLPVASGSRGQGTRNSRRQEATGDASNGTAQTEEQDEEFVPTKRKNKVSGRKRKRRSLTKTDSGSESQDSDESWGVPEDESSDDGSRSRSTRTASKSTRSERAAAREQASGSKGKRAARRGRASSKRRRIAVGSDSDESLASDGSLEDSD
jgi:hypothetical protein